MSPTFDVSNWGSISLPVTTDNNPLGEKPTAVWFRKDVVIPTDWIGKDLELHLGIIDSGDESYVNGHRMGRTWFDTDHYWQVSRVYPVPAGEVTSTNVAIVLRLVKLALKTDTNSAVALHGFWRLCRILRSRSGSSAALGSLTQQSGARCLLRPARRPVQWSDSSAHPL